MGILTRVRRRQRYGAMLGLALVTGGCNLVPFDQDLVFASLFAQDLDQVGSVRIENWDRFDDDDPIEPIAFFPDYLYLDGSKTRSLERGFLVSKIGQQLEVQYLNGTAGLSQTQSTNINSSAGALGVQLFHIPVAFAERQFEIGMGRAEPASALVILQGEGQVPTSSHVVFDRNSGNIAIVEDVLLGTQFYEVAAAGAMDIPAGDPEPDPVAANSGDLVVRGVHFNVVPANWQTTIDIDNSTSVLAAPVATPLVLFSVLFTTTNVRGFRLSETVIAVPGLAMVAVGIFTPSDPTTPTLLSGEAAWVSRRADGLYDANQTLPFQSSSSLTEAQNIAFAPALIANQNSSYAFTTGFSSNNDLVTYSWDPVGAGTDYGVVSGELAPSYRRVDGTVFDGRTGSVRAGQVGGAKRTRELGSLYYLGEYLTPDETAIRDLYSSVRAVRRNGDTALEIDIYADAITTSAP